MKTPIIERAFELAGSGHCESVKEIRSELKAEGYTMVDQYIDGSALLKKLKLLLAQAGPISAPSPARCLPEASREV